jgi:hypothetical protein
MKEMNKNVQITHSGAAFMDLLWLWKGASRLTVEFITFSNFHFITASNYCREILSIMHHIRNKDQAGSWNRYKFVIALNGYIYTSEFSVSLVDIDPSMGDIWVQIFGPKDIVVKESTPRLGADPVVHIGREETCWGGILKEWQIFLLLDYKNSDRQTTATHHQLSHIYRNVGEPWLSVNALINCSICIIQQQIIYWNMDALATCMIQYKTIITSSNKL